MKRNIYVSFGVLIGNKYNKATYMLLYVIEHLTNQQLWH